MLLKRTQLVRLSVPAFSMPPPGPITLPPVMVTPEICTMAPAAISNTRSLIAPAVMTTTLAPAPVIVRFTLPLMSRVAAGAVVGFAGPGQLVCARPAGRWCRSRPCRRRPSRPSAATPGRRRPTPVAKSTATVSARLLTVKTVGVVRSSNTSRLRRMGFLRDGRRGAVASRFLLTRFRQYDRNIEAFPFRAEEPLRRGVIRSGGTGDRTRVRSCLLTGPVQPSRGAASDWAVPARSRLIHGWLV